MRLGFCASSLLGIGVRKALNLQSEPQSPLLWELHRVMAPLDPLVAAKHSVCEWLLDGYRSQAGMPELRGDILLRRRVQVVCEICLALVTRYT